MSTTQSLPLTHPPRATPLQNRVQSWLTPSFCDVFFLAFIGWSFMASGTGWSRLLWDGDTSLHTAIGRWILDHGHIPVTDPFSFTQPGTPWLAVEWGTEVLFASLLQAFGLKGIVFLCGAMIAALIAILLRTMLSAGSDGLFSIIVALLASNALSLHYHARPHLFTLLFLAITAWIVTQDRQQPTRWIWLLPGLTALWVNLHPGFAILFAYLGVLVAGSAIEWTLGNGLLAQTMRYAWVMLACGAATFLNPFGWKLNAEVLSYFRASGMMDLIQEFQAPTFRSAPQLCFLAFLLAGLALCGLFLSQKRVVEPLLILGLAYASLTSVRHSTVFVVIVAPLIAAELSRYWRNWVERQPRNSAARILDALSEEKRPAFSRNSVWIVAGLAAIFFWAPEGQWPTGFDRDLFPVDIAARHPELAGARLFTSEQWADYLLLRNYPRQTVFYDDRSVYGEKMFRLVQNLLNGGAGWQAALDQYHTELVLIPPKSPLSARLHESLAWTMVDQN
ncbi:MAG TPA: hypothetical protein VKG25_16470, partial [Bryobacteraceae bacterium]|nr:hypothetical protein [Bryobacteraceae bacterium]